MNAEPRNAKTGIAYSGKNVGWLLSAQDKAGYLTAEWLTFRQARMLGGTVNLDEHGTCIVRVVTRKSNEDEAPRRVLKHYMVFNVAQCRNLHELELDARWEIEASEAAA